MANEEQLKILKQGVDVWNKWRQENRNVGPSINAIVDGAMPYGIDLAGADLGKACLKNANLTSVNLAGANLREADLRQADLEHSYIFWADFKGANLEAAYFHRAKLQGADFRLANLSEADLSGAHLVLANFGRANLERANFEHAELAEVVLNDVDLSAATGLEKCRHSGPSIVDHRTLQRSENVPVKFWRSCGLPDTLIDYMPSLTGEAIQFYSCFISYSSKDQEFADRLHADLQDNGVRCWFAPHDLQIGAKTWDGIDQAIRTRDKVLLILSEGAIASDWVEDEVTTAFAEERRRDKLVLFPVRVDGAVMDTDEPWAGKLRDNRNIGDFSKWKNYEAYKGTLDRVLRDLKASC